MRKRLWPLLLTFCAVTLLSAPLASAENDQTVVVGLGLGSHSFSRSDDLREGSDFFAGSDEITSGGASTFFVEWYALGDLGFGYRSMSIGATRTYSAAFEKLEQDIDIALGFITVNWVPIGGTDYVRMGVVGGYGGMSYEATETYTNTFSPENSYAVSGRAAGRASLVGLYVDWGAEDFGARFGSYGISTDVTDTGDFVSTVDLDASGATLALDLRWAWQ